MKKWQENNCYCQEQYNMKIKLKKIEKELEKNRTSVIQDGWQTQRHAKKSRKWDFLAIEKMELIKKISEYEK
tara:strand:- start:124 stop:339 length:216 start_codon:yes stop_codon:yes gene_type:complete